MSAIEKGSTIGEIVSELSEATDQFTTEGSIGLTETIARACGFDINDKKGLEELLAKLYDEIGSQLDQHSLQLWRTGHDLKIRLIDLSEGGDEPTTDEPMIVIENPHRFLRRPPAGQLRTTGRRRTITLDDFSMN